jgi:LmbE family N-acetylglucosaminyl deacetylase
MAGTSEATTGTLLCVHPHPDDESIACGGVLARAVAQGHRAVVVTCTGGEAGENLAGIDLGGEDLVVHRRRERPADQHASQVTAILGARVDVLVGLDERPRRLDRGRHIDRVSGLTAELGVEREHAHTGAHPDEQLGALLRIGELGVSQ